MKIRLKIICIYLCKCIFVNDYIKIDNETMNSSVSELLKNGELYSVDCEDQKSLFSFLNGQLLGRGMVRETFYNALTEREKNFPTGIVDDPFNIALPHVDSEHVKTNALIVCRLKNEVMFHRMDKVVDTIPVKMVFLLLIQNEKMHVEALMNLTNLWTDQKFMNELLTLDKKDDLVHELEERRL